jgi:hypothetical protein
LLAMHSRPLLVNILVPIRARVIGEVEVAENLNLNREGGRPA